MRIVIGIPKNIRRFLEKRRGSKNPVLRVLLKFYGFVGKKHFQSLPCPILIQKKRIIYFPIDKAANTSLRQYFREIDGKSKHLSRGRVKKYKNHFKVAFVRNPYDRLVSCYINKVLFPYRETRFIRDIPGMKKEMSFKEFVKIICSLPDSKADRHVKSQYCFLTDKQGKLLPDFIGKFEDLKEDFEKACKKAGIKNPPKLPHKNPSKRKGNYKDYYDKETRRLVQKRYKKDFELFDYGF